MIVVFGSINMDLVVRTPRLPKPGETLVGHTFYTAPGGKGANQAVACARLGAPTAMVGLVGSDVFAETLRGSLHDYGVDVSGVETCADQPSGVALIAVDDRAENNIIIVTGANGAVGAADLARLESVLAAGAKVLLLQFEIPMDSIVAAAKLARRHGVLVMLDPAPARPMPAALYRLVDTITPNETEAAALVGFAVNDQAGAARAADVLRGRGVRRVVVKMGSKGAYWTDDRDVGQLCPAFRVEAVDTVAAGDAFNGALAVALSEGQPFGEAIRLAAAAGALATTKHGAQPSMPDRAAVRSLLAAQR